MDKCQQSGVCCRLFFVNLTKEEYNSEDYKTQFQEFGLIKNFTQAQECGANILAQKEDGSCVYLKGNLCSIHRTRPQSCREFFCTSKDPKFQGMIKTINKKKALFKA